MALRNFWSNLTIREVSGSLGDLGTFLPLLVGLVQARRLDLGTTLICTGLYNVVSGALFGIPMPVQPMKAIAAVALSEVELSEPEIAAAGIFVGAVVLSLGATRLIILVHSLIPTAVVRGLQLGVGLNLAQKGVVLVCYQDQKAERLRGLGGSESIFVGIAAVAFIFLTVFPYEKLELPLTSKKRTAAEAAQEDDHVNRESPRSSQGPSWQFPAALIVILTGIVATLILHPNVAAGIHFGPSKPTIVMPTLNEWKRGIWRGGIAQLPLTLLNSVVAVCQLAEDLFPEKAPSATLVSVSVGAMNLGGTWFGSMPCCHGAGGLAAQVRFGASSGAAPIFLGLVKVALGLAFGSSLLKLLQSFPGPLLGSMLLISGMELAATCRAQKGQRGGALMLLTASAIMGTKNTAAGFVAGVAAALLVTIYDKAGRLLAKHSAFQDYQRQGYGILEGQAAEGGGLQAT